MKWTRNCALGLVLLTTLACDNKAEPAPEPAEDKKEAAAQPAEKPEAKPAEEAKEEKPRFLVRQLAGPSTASLARRILGVIAEDGTAGLQPHRTFFLGQSI